MKNTNWWFQYDIPSIKLELTCRLQAPNEVVALARFRKRRPHGRIMKINDRIVCDDGLEVRTPESQMFRDRTPACSVTFPQV